MELLANIQKYIQALLNFINKIMKALDEDFEEITLPKFEIPEIKLPF